MAVSQESDHLLWPRSPAEIAQHTQCIRAPLYSMYTVNKQGDDVRAKGRAVPLSEQETLSLSIKEYERYVLSRFSCVYAYTAPTDPNTYFYSSAGNTAQPVRWRGGRYGGTRPPFSSTL